VATPIIKPGKQRIDFVADGGRRFSWRGHRTPHLAGPGTLTQAYTLILQFSTKRMTYLKHTVGTLSEKAIVRKALTTRRM
jgi:hypothetical protein